MTGKDFEIIDSHCHIYPDKIAVKASEATGNFYNVKMKFDGSVSSLLSQMDKAGVAKSLVHSVATTPHQVSSINRFISASAAESGGRFIGFGALHPDSEDIRGDVEELISLGLLGVKLHPDIQRFRLDEPRCMKMYEAIEGRVPLLIHAGDDRYDMSNPNRIIPILDAFPDLTVIAAHFGGYTVWEEAFEKLKGRKNVYVDTSSSFWKLTDEQILRYIDGYGTDHVFFGSDYPMWDVTDELERLFSLGLSESECRCILGENLKKLLGI